MMAILKTALVGTAVFGLATGFLSNSATAIGGSTAHQVVASAPADNYPIPGGTPTAH